MSLRNFRVASEICTRLIKTNYFHNNFLLNIPQQFLPGKSTWFHVISDDNIVRPNVKMPLFVAQHTTHNRSTMYSNSHIQIYLYSSNSIIFQYKNTHIGLNKSSYMSVMSHVLDSPNHVQTRFHTANCMVRTRLPAVGIEHWNAVVAITKQFYAQTVVVLKKTDCTKLKLRSAKLEPKYLLLRFYQIAQTDRWES